jgi:hypothetical protein
MPKYIIERDMPGAGGLDAEHIRGAAATSCNALQEVGGGIQWLESFVTDDKIYCVYIAPDEAAIRKHAELAGFPANRISQVTTITNAEAAP